MSKKKNLNTSPIRELLQRKPVKPELNLFMKNPNKGMTVEEVNESNKILFEEDVKTEMVLPVIDTVEGADLTATETTPPDDSQTMFITTKVDDVTISMVESPWFDRKDLDALKEDFDAKHLDRILTSTDKVGPGLKEQMKDYPITEENIVTKDNLIKGIEKSNEAAKGLKEKDMNFTEEDWSKELRKKVEWKGTTDGQEVASKLGVEFHEKVAELLKAVDEPLLISDIPDEPSPEEAKDIREKMNKHIENVIAKMDELDTSSITGKTPTIDNIKLEEILPVIDTDLIDEPHITIPVNSSLDSRIGEIYIDLKYSNVREFVVTPRGTIITVLIDGVTHGTSSPTSQMASPLIDKMFAAIKASSKYKH